MTERNVPNLEKNTTFILLHSGLRVNKEKEKTYIYFLLSFLGTNILCADSYIHENDAYASPRTIVALSP